MVFGPDDFKRHLSNSQLALRLWQERVKPAEVIESLGAWHCGTQACFGGHLVTWPEFQAMGVRRGLSFLSDGGDDGKQSF